jgi:prohibitin 1
MFMKKSLLLFLTLVALLASSCIVIRQGEIGVKRKFGKFSPYVLGPGLHGFNPFTTVVLIEPVRTINLEMALDLPSKEGLTIRSDISILYRIEKAAMPQVLEEIGTNYEQILIASTFRSAAADVSARFFAKDMHSGERSVIEKQIQARMHELVADRGFEIEAVLMKSIQLPKGLAQAIENKLEAEQRSQEMEFVLGRERQEAQRKIIAAEGERDAQQIISQGLTDEIIQLRQIEALEKLSTSPNAKVIIMPTTPSGPRPDQVSQPIILNTSN